MGPVMEGLISYSNLTDGSINLFDIYIMKEALEYRNKYNETKHDILFPEVKNGRKQ